MGSTIIRFGTPHAARGQGRGACEALALLLMLSGMCNDASLWFINTVVFANHNRLQLFTDNLHLETFAKRLFLPQHCCVFANAYLILNKLQLCC